MRGRERGLARRSVGVWERLHARRKGRGCERPNVRLSVWSDRQKEWEYGGVRDCKAEGGLE